MPLLHEIVGQHAAERPTAPALVDETGALSYRALHLGAARLAARLQAAGVGPGTIVAISTEDAGEAVIAILAILSCGAAFQPLDPAYPTERTALLLADAAPRAVLASAAAAASLPAHGGETLRLDPVDRAALERDAAGAPNSTDARDQVSPADLAYVIHTSGSSGRPKGVLVPHRGIENLARAQGEIFAVTGESRILQFASLNFDAAVAEIAVALYAGAALHVAPRAARLPVEPLAALLADRAITHVTLPPSVAAAMPGRMLPEGMTIILAGEPAGAALVGRLCARHTVFNAYGPTEGTVCATIGLCRPDGAPPSIGTPMSGTRIEIVDEAGAPVAVGETGEILIGGIGVADGYLGQPDLTAERFVTREGGRFYRTGDRGRWRADGEIDYLGRLDSQLKVRGHRVEPGEVEAVLCAHPSVAAAAVILAGEGPAAHLLAYCVGQDGAAIDRDGLSAHLARHLPAYMRPARIVTLDALPVSPNGKIDRARLPAPDREAEGFDGEAQIGPRDEIEIALAAAFRDVLGIAPPSVRSDFFRLGGTSLMAAQVASRIGRDLGHTLPLEAFAENATVERLAMAVRAARDGDGTAASPLTALSSEGDGPPLLLVHPAGGTVLAYVDLARTLSGRCPVYGLQAVGLAKDGPPANDRIEDMARAYIEAVRERLAPRVWRLAGWSFGASVVFEMAVQLIAAGENVAPPVFIDAPVRHQMDAIGEMDIIGRLIRLYSEVWSLGGAPADAAQDIETLVARAVEIGVFPPDFEAAQAKRLAAVVAGCFRAGSAFEPGRLPGDAVLIRAADNPVKVADDRLGWGDLVDGTLDLVFVGGTHTSILRPPHVADLAQAILAAQEGRIASSTLVS
ncbi:amino acid adenylation domain-containing protein [Acuticoccus kandeliae]|uniref:amino acid adenylation domain-containing protein n=1 Tax=Acuticoccus kandeliae TaxID=2073160 RepID=UPI000D3ED484|nr:amino acid adenylation domain-containing protein [Acuticoccus kandeliae]